MAGLKIYWTSTALAQRNYIFQYWNERNKNPSYSIKLNSKIKGRINLLKIRPYLGKLTEFKNTRILSLGHYSIFYQQVGSMIIITGFWDQSAKS